MVDWKRPDDSSDNYIILESLDLEKNSSRIIHTVIANDRKFKFTLGRGHESDLRINDISVSRLHAHIEYKDGNFVLVDCRSKFGTLALHHGHLPLDVEQLHTLQIGRTVVTINSRIDHPTPARNQEKLDLESIQRQLAKMNIRQGEGNHALAYLHQDRQKIIEVDGKRYLVIQELPNEGSDVPNEGDDGFS